MRRPLCKCITFCRLLKRCKNGPVCADDECCLFKETELINFSIPSIIHNEDNDASSNFWIREDLCQCALYM